MGQWSAMGFDRNYNVQVKSHNTAASPQQHFTKPSSHHHMLLQPSYHHRLHPASSSSATAQAVRLIKRELEFQAKLHEEEIDTLQAHLNTAVRELLAITAERDALLHMVMHMRRGGFELDRPEDGAILDTLAGAPAELSREKVLESVADAGARAWEAYGSASSGQQQQPQSREKALSKVEQEELVSRLHREGNAKHKETMMKILGRKLQREANSHLTVGTTPLKEEDRQKVTERMYAAAASYRERKAKMADMEARRIERMAHQTIAGTPVWRSAPSQPSREKVITVPPAHRPPPDRPAAAPRSASARGDHSRESKAPGPEPRNSFEHHS